MADYRSPWMDEELELFRDAARRFVTIGDYRRSIVDRLFGALLSARLDEIANSPNAPFLRAETDRGLLVRTAEVTELTAVGLYKIVVGQLDRKNIGGPIQIAVTAGEQARQGLPSLAFFTAVISVNLFLLNLLPVPMLDATSTFPDSSFAISRLIDRPRPVPPNRRLVVPSAYWNGSKISASRSCAIPIPVSRTANATPGSPPSVVAA